MAGRAAVFELLAVDDHSAVPATAFLEGVFPPPAKAPSKSQKQPTSKPHSSSKATSSQVVLRGSDSARGDSAPCHALSWQLLLFFHGEELRLAASKQRLTEAQESARDEKFGESTRGYDAYKDSLLVPGYMAWADQNLLPMFAQEEVIHP
jgi:hypothetical protein